MQSWGKVRHTKSELCLKNKKRGDLQCLEAAYITLGTQKKNLIQKQCTFSNEFRSKVFFAVN